MAISIPPPPTSAEQNSRVWTDWYVRLAQVLTSTAGVAWGLVDKAGSKLSDLASRPHSQLTSILGDGEYHLSSAERDAVYTMYFYGLQSMQSGAADPTTSVYAPNAWILYKNTTSGEVRVWVNDGGTMKKSAAFT